MGKRGLFLAVGVLLVLGLYLVLENKNKLVPVPLVRAEDGVRAFFNLIDEGRVAETVDMMTDNLAGDEGQKQAWKAMWNSFEEVKVREVERVGDKQYKVVLETKMKEGFEISKPIPFYGYGEGEFTRWVEVEKKDKMWKISNITTGP